MSWSTDSWRVRDQENRIVAGVPSGAQAPGLLAKRHCSGHGRHGAAKGSNIAYGRHPRLSAGGTIPTVRSRISGENLLFRAMTPSSQGMEPPAIPARFTDGKTEKPAAQAYRVTRRWLLGMRMKNWSLASTDCPISSRGMTFGWVHPRSFSRGTASELGARNQVNQGLRLCERYGSQRTILNRARGSPSAISASSIRVGSPSQRIRRRAQSPGPVACLMRVKIHLLFSDSKGSNSTTIRHPWTRAPPRHG